MEGIRILTNPATLNTHHWLTPSRAPVVLCDACGQNIGLDFLSGDLRVYSAKNGSLTSLVPTDRRKWLTPLLPRLRQLLSQLGLLPTCIVIRITAFWMA